MEDTLGVENSFLAVSKQSLNPCSNGRYSRRQEYFKTRSKSIVLILVLMEDTLGGEIR